MDKKPAVKLRRENRFDIGTYKAQSESNRAKCMLCGEPVKDDEWYFRGPIGSWYKRYYHLFPTPAPTRACPGFVLSEGEFVLTIMAMVSKLGIDMAANLHAYNTRTETGDQ